MQGDINWLTTALVYGLEHKGEKNRSTGTVNKKVIQGINCIWEIKIHPVSFARQYKFG